MTHSPDGIAIRPYALEIHLTSPCTGNLVDFALSTEEEEEFTDFLTREASALHLLGHSTDVGITNRIVDLWFDAACNPSQTQIMEGAKIIRSFLIHLILGQSFLRDTGFTIGPGGRILTLEEADSYSYPEDDVWMERTGGLFEIREVHRRESRLLATEKDPLRARILAVLFRKRLSDPSGDPQEARDIRARARQKDPALKEDLYRTLGPAVCSMETPRKDTLCFQEKGGRASLSCNGRIFLEGGPLEQAYVLLYRLGSRLAHIRDFYAVHQQAFERAGLSLSDVIRCYL